ncbi:MAG: DUF1611 domain-containing protein [Candidatus Marinimicrobia bacterium]|nr:hypothetical protein [Candidatus Neomarinimicrobiota bacterium]MDP6457535.1 DUF1611 domain-containing protein [Candidatus Neomarinimicrobiota bacterium]MDP6593005.1 DUF1611 domain-containing protein [Candidatus Neomarinimicrobiota bacterium]MDP6835716.1 DUF1611 domain-containing protein [Candidatus Neomarinimicrobiota bacterium]
MNKYAILVEGEFNYLYAKTANAILRYCPEEVVCIIDSTNVGKTSKDVIGYGGDLPIVASVDDALAYEPRKLLIGIANPGGILPDSWRQSIVTAIESELEVICGLHFFLNDDPEFSRLAKKHGVKLTDLRRPPSPLPFSKGTWQTRKTPVLLTVGTDCDTGKMTAAWELKNLLEEKGKTAAFVGTGQTGILLGGYGAAVDAVVSDFVAGTIEAEIDKVGEDYDLIIVEGQGSITHMAYSGVTLGLLHGTMPDFMLMGHEEEREMDTFDYPMIDFDTIMDLYLRLVRVFKPCEVVGIGLLTHLLNEEKAKAAVRKYEKRYGIPTTDFIRFGSRDVLNNILSKLRD